MQALFAHRLITRVENEEGSTRVIDAGGAATCISNCRDCHFTLTGRATKLIVEGCHNCTIFVEGPVTTGIAEVINCRSVALYLRHRIPTIQADGCTGCRLVLRNRQCLYSLYTARTTQMTIALESGTAGEAGGEEAYEVDYSSGEWDHDQYITRFMEEGAPLLTEVVIREGVGYPTTVREKEINDARERQLQEALTNFLDSELFPASQGADSGGR